MKKHLVLCAVMLVFLLALLPTVSGCGSTSGQTNATLLGTGAEGLSAEAKAADDAIAALAKSTNVDTPPTLEDGVLVVGCDGDSPPLEYRATVITFKGGEQIKTETPVVVGFEADLCAAAATKMGLKVRFEQIAWSALVPALDSGQIDIVMSAMATSPDQLLRMDATEPHLAADFAICTSVASPLANEGGLKGKIVGVQRDTPAHTFVQNLEGVGEVRVYTQILSAFGDLTSGKLDAVVGDQPACAWILENDPAYSTEDGRYAVTGRIETGDGYAFWCEKGNEVLRAAMNAALQELRQVPDAAPTATSTTVGATGTIQGATSTTVAATSTTVSTVAPAKSVYQLICEKWGLTGN